MRFMSLPEVLLCKRHLSFKDNYINHTKNPPLTLFTAGFSCLFIRDKVAPLSQ